MNRLNQRAGEFLPVDDEPTQPVGVERRVQRVARVRTAEVRRPPEWTEDPVRRRVAHDDVPHRVDDEGGVGLLLAQDELQRAAHVIELGRREIALAVERRVPGGEQQHVAVGEGDVEHRAQALHHRATGVRAPRLQEAQVANGNVRVGGERQLIHTACLSPLTQQPSEARRLRFTCQVNLR